MRQASSRRCLCAVMIAACCLTSSAAFSAQAGKGTGNVVRSSGQHVSGGHGGAYHKQRHFRHDRFKSKRFDRRRARGNVVRRADRKRRNRHLPRYAYGYGWDYGYQVYARPEPSYRSEADETVQPYQNRPVTPKWVHVGGSDGAPFTAEGFNAEGGSRKNCLSVKTEITVDGKPVDAFGEACLLADGSWALRSSKEPAQKKE